MKCLMSLAALTRVWNKDGVTDDNRLTTSWSELWVYPIPAALYLVKNLMQACYTPSSALRRGCCPLPGLRVPLACAVLHFPVRRRAQLPDPQKPEHHLNRHPLPARALMPDARCCCASPNPSRRAPAECPLLLASAGSS